MRISLKTRLFGAFFGLMIFSVTLSWILNGTLLQKYYFNEKKSTMLENYETIKESYKNDSENIVLDIEKIENLGGLNVLIFDKDYTVIYQSRDRNFGNIKEKLNIPGGEPVFERELLSEKLSQIQSDQPLVEFRYDRRMDSNFISLVAKIDEGVYLYLGSPFAAIQQSSRIAVKFSIFTGILTLLLGGIIIYVLTAKQIKPILKLDNIAKKMAYLDFSQRYDEKRTDEIGTLGQSINSLSEQLERSIGELTQANRKLQEDIEKERKIDEMRKGFISNVSHELKTPIALIQGYAEGLKYNIIEDEENKNYYCEVIIDEAVKMNSMVKKLLSLSELEFNDITLEREDFCINEMIQDVIKKKGLLIDEKGIYIEFINNGLGEVQINADYYLTEQVLINYLNNALNHVDDRKIISIELNVTENKARVEVFNTGLNIPVDAIENIWLSFYKVDKARTRAYGGTGLGLSIVKATQNAHNNGYGVENTKDGVIFWFETDLAR